MTSKGRTGWDKGMLDKLAKRKVYKCVQCGKVFEPIGKQTGDYCSRECLTRFHTTRIRAENKFLENIGE